ncbi:hypothetical protein G5C63_19670 [Stenotrophomonas pavanii]|uniref:hypothetical protein n=1 Tax=Stenotrophomonas pavanii TaxID=487698 RepID=UPI0013E09238|nr:hypothetical protein [Stenotrophomonas pavanii]NGM56527.1 hypothetical protein [Stenotrophomonas pavanii]
MTTDNKTLADVQPGGRVRLGDQAERARFEAWGHTEGLPLARSKLGGYAFEITARAWRAWQYLSAQPSQVTYHGDVDLKWLSGSIGEVAHRLSTCMPTGLAEWAVRARDCRIAAQVLSELSAQPSPGDQGDALRSFACEAVEYFRNRSDVVDGDYGSPSPNEEMILLSEGEAALAARQPAYVQGSDELRARTEGERAAYMEGLEEGKKIAARQPVGEPVVKSVGIDALAKLLEDEAAECEKAWVERADTYMSGRASGFLLAAEHFRKIATSQRWSEFLSSPAQAVDHQAALLAEERAHGETIDQRDRYHEVADELADHIARITGVDIGEHSSANCPWQNAIDAAEEYKPAQAVDLDQFRPAVCAMGLYAEEPEDVDEAKRLMALLDSHTAGGHP